MQTENTDPESAEPRVSWGSNLMRPIGESTKRGSFLNMLRMNLGGTPSAESA